MVGRSVHQVVRPILARKPLTIAESLSMINLLATMRSILTQRFVVVCVAVLGISLLHADPNPEMATDKLQWVQKCLADFQAIKVGMTRRQVDSMFRTDGGFQGVVTVCFTHPTCRYFKIDVEFDVQRNPAEQGRVVKGMGDKVIRVSKPYIEAPNYD